MTEAGKYLTATAEKMNATAYYNEGLRRWIIQSNTDDTSRKTIQPLVLEGMYEAAIDALVREVTGTQIGDAR